MKATRIFIGLFVCTLLTLTVVCYVWAEMI